MIFSSEIDKIFKKSVLEKRYQYLNTIFSDNSYEKIIKKIGDNKILTFTKIKNNSYELTTINNKTNTGNTFSINYNKTNGKINKLVINDILSKFFILNGFDSFKVSNLKYSVADTIIIIKDAILYIPRKLTKPLIFNGKIKLLIKPEDKEEEKQFIHLFGHNYKTFKPKWIIYYSDKTNIIKTDALKNNISFNNRYFLNSFKKFFSFHLQEVKDYTFFLLPDKNENLIIFPLSSKKIMIYSNNKNRIPDTQLYGFNFKKILLDYNYYKTPKFVLEDNSSNIKSINLNINLNKKEKSTELNAKEKIETMSNISKLTLELPEEITIKKLYSPEDFKLIIFNNMKNIYINGRKFKHILLDYTLQVKNKDDFDLNYSSRRLNIFDTYIINKRLSNIVFLSRDSNYYLKDRLSFIKFHLKVNNDDLRCFSAGEEISRNEFKSESVKGFPLICGNFHIVKNNKAFKENNKIKFYSNSTLNNTVLKDMMKFPELFKFYTNIYGQLDLKKINIVMRESSSLSALSYKGLIYMNIPWNMLKHNYSNSPVKFKNGMLDIISHEIAHQWFGGLISWDSYKDIWITEGFANLSSILYLKKEFGEKEYHKIIIKINKTVMKKYEYGPVSYGKRVGNWEDDTNAYFSIIYNKSALILLMLKEIMGENQFFNRVKQLLLKYRYKSISTSTFIRFFCGNSKLIRDFLHIWIYNRDLPKIKYKLKIKDKELYIHIKQVNKDLFIFPLKIKIYNGNEYYYKKILVKEKNQIFKINLKPGYRKARLIKYWITPLK